MLPLFGAAAFVQYQPLLRSDQALLAGLGQAQAWSGGLSTALSRLCLGLPMGNLGFRLALPSVLGAGLLGWACFELAYALFRAQGGHSRLDPWLAWGASLVGALCAPSVSEATVVGGATLGPAVALLICARLVARAIRRETTSIIACSVSLAALLCESVLLAVLMLFAAVLLWPDHPARPGRTPQRSQSRPVQSPRWPLGILAAGAALGTVVTIAFFAGWFHGGGWLSSGGLEERTTAAAFDPSRPWAWTRALGVLWCLGAAFALVFALRDRRPLYVMGLFALADWLVPALPAAGWVDATTSDAGRTGLHLLALGYLAAAGALGLRTFGETAHALGLWGAGQLSSLLSIVAVAGGLASSEDALLTLSQTEANGAQAWSESAFFSLPPRSLVITHSADRGQRLRAAQLQGARPDVLVVPLTELAQARHVAGWMKREPALQLLLIDLSLGGAPSERALATLVDTRPVYVEPKPDWDPRLLDHLEPGIPLCRVSPHALARSERLAALDKTPPVIDEIVSRARAGIRSDEATLGLLQRDLEQLAATLATVDHVAEERVRDLSPFTPRELDVPVTTKASLSVSARR